MMASRLVIGFLTFPGNSELQIEHFLDIVLTGKCLSSESVYGKHEANLSALPSASNKLLEAHFIPF